MGMVDRFIGSPRDRFARQVLATVRGAGMAEAWYDRDQFVIGYRRAPGSSDDGWIYLGNVFHECQGLGRAERTDRIVRLVSSVVNSPVVPESWEQARPHLRPVLRAATFAQSAASGGRQPLRRPAWPYLQELAVLDYPTSMAYVTVDQTRTWGVPETVVFDAARANLAALAGDSATAAGGDDGPAGGDDGPAGPAVLRFVDTGDAYFASRLLLDGWLGSLAPRVGGRPVAFVPDHNTLVVVADEPDALSAVFKLVEEEYGDAARQVSPQAYTVDGYGAVVPYAAPDGHPLAAAVGRAGALLAATEYQAQADWLTKEYERDGRDIFVGKLILAGRDDGSVFTVASWAEGVDTLLPRADYVAFGSDQRPSFFVPWDVVEREVDLVPAEGLYPVRYRLTAWPPAPVVDRLNARAVPL
ncbi:MAG: hypothetical protein AUI14_26200 [Actinobacteria bacterium 13_2_20CM_2_71_6]|nr:MAG: hypothetical protein AUI14_26200 [Actinobacteria bacterium 13_2_20CM_2_71_6]